MTSPPRISPEHASVGTRQIVGRHAHLDRLRAALDEPGPRGTLLELPGEPASGKTRLLAAFREEAKAREVPVWTASGALHGARPGGGRPRAGAAPPVRHPAGAPDGRGGAGADLRAAFAAATGPGGTGLLLLDDLHAADRRSAQTLAALLRDPVPGLVVAAAYRPRQCPPWVRSALEGGATASWRLPVGPLSRADAALMAPGHPAASVDRAHALSQGLPGYAAALLREAEGAPAPDFQEEPVPLQVPGLDAELAALGEDERQVLDIAAVLGEPVDPGLLVAVAARSPAHCAHVVDRLAALDLLRPYPDPPHAWGFRHPLVRAACYHRVLPGQRWLLHTRAAAVLRRRAAPLTEIAEHVARGDCGSDPHAAADLAAAAHDVLPTRPDRAARWLRTALRLTRDPAGRAGITLALAEAEMASGRPWVSRTLLTDMCAAQGDQHQLTLARLAHSRAELMMGRPREGYVPLRRELPRAERVGGALGVRVAAEAAVCAVLDGNRDAVRHLELASRLLPSAPAAAFDTRLAVIEAFTAAYVGGIPAVGGRLASAAAVIDERSDDECAADLGTLTLLAWAETMLERDGEALRHFARGLRVTDRGGPRALTPYLLAGQAHAAARQGRVEAALAAAAEARGAARRMGNAPLAEFADVTHAASVARRDGSTAATPTPVAGAGGSPPDAGSWFAAMTARTAVRLRWERGDPAVTTELLLRACGGAELPRVEACGAAYWAGVLMDLALARGDTVQAAGWARTAEERAEQSGLDGQRGHALASRARLEAHRERPTTAAALAAGAAERFAALGFLHDEASARLVRARALGDLREWREAEVEMAQVRVIAQATGSRALLGVVVTEQRRVGACAGRQSAPASPGHLGLTRREWDIARRVAAGASNAEVAATLYVSVKTVESHLTRIFRKLGMTSRNGLAAALTVA
ncbi:LuxR C-terminal-related transcriptional regulator [Actinacidiphila reveromycinica]|uniref:LuxR C-terminal-related transcriptional regulator n=1 Tax=Actinacidiphila reveromycinica TaxID=659352 RepID=UPI001922F23E|nr:LuxR C-terminal-related transcriptional regulator [Streptomyces sp. SN-593]